MIILILASFFFFKYFYNILDCVFQQQSPIKSFINLIRKFTCLKKQNKIKTIFEFVLSNINADKLIKSYLNFFFIFTCGIFSSLLLLSQYFVHCTLWPSSECISIQVTYRFYCACLVTSHLVLIFSTTNSVQFKHHNGTIIRKLISPTIASINLIIIIRYLITSFLLD